MSIVRHLFELAGWSAVVTGLWMAWPPLALIGGGVSALALAFLWTMSEP